MEKKWKEKRKNKSFVIDLLLACSIYNSIYYSDCLDFPLFFIHIHINTIRLNPIDVNAVFA